MAKGKQQKSIHWFTYSWLEFGRESKGEEEIDRVLGMDQENKIRHKGLPV